MPKPVMPKADDLARVFDMVWTERLALRRPDASDAVAFFQLDGDPETNRFSVYGPAPDQATSDARLQEWLQQWQEDGYGYWALAVSPNSAVVGFGGVRRITWQGQVVLNLYYKLQPAIWRHGYATELARAAIGLAQTHLPHLPIIARTRPDNLASQRTAERAGLLRRPDLDTAEYVIFALRWQAPTLE
jgi:RimJ/RimL family protein N-acetyltransferase